MKKFTTTMSMRGMINKLKDWKFSAKISFFVLGIASTVWFLIRVIPKPSRATYPCMRAAAPIMSGFIIYLISITASVFAFRKFGKKIMSAKYFAAAGLLIAAIVFVFVAGSVNNFHIKAAQVKYQTAFVTNAPIGIATGLKPGRVVWVYDPTATNNSCTNTEDDYWYENINTNQTAVNKMLADGIKNYVGTTSLTVAWDSLFRYFNTKHSKGNVGYTAGEKIVIKVNMTNMGKNTRTVTELMDATPQLMVALLDELVDSLNIPQANITMGDPYRSFGDIYWSTCHDKYPSVHYIDGSNADGRELTAISSSAVFFTSDVAHPFSSRLPQAYLDASYMINMPCMKSHNSAGITLAAKNHQGSVIAPSQDAGSQYMGNDLHYDYPDNADNQDTGIYRHLVDYMAHSKLGGNTLVYIVDAIWTGRNWNGFVDKWGMPPFSGSYPSSLFISQDPVATESVGFDFLYNEYNSYRANYHENDDFPLWVGVEDYIRQAADSSHWPAGIKYDPDHADHHAPFKSLGTQEHWNNMTEKKYSRNLGTGNGIELVQIVENVTAISYPQSIASMGLKVNCYPNPVRDMMNVEYTLSENAGININIYSLNGSLIKNMTIANETQGTHIASIPVNGTQFTAGQYICRVTAIANNKTSSSSVKINILSDN